MDDLRFRRDLYADPTNIDTDLQQAINKDPKKAYFAEELVNLERKIESALHVDIPEGLSDKLILRQTMISHKQQKRKTKIQLAIAASVAFAVGLSLNFFQSSSAYSQLSDHALAHVYHEQDLLTQPVNTQLTLASLNQKMANFGGNFNSLIGHLIAANYCRFDGIKSLHLVFQGENAPITVFIVPNNNALDVARYFSDDSFHGQTIQFKHSNVVLISDKQQSLTSWQNKIDEKIQWSI